MNLFLQVINFFLLVFECLTLKCFADDVSKFNEKTSFVLHFARGEYGSVVVEESGSSENLDIKNLRLEWKKLNRKMVIPTLSVQPFLLASHYLARSSFQEGTLRKWGVNKREVSDILIPLPILSQVQFRYPKENRPSRNRVLVEFFCDPHSPVGKFSGFLIYNQGSKVHRFPLHVTVYPYQLRSPFKLHTSFGFAPWGVLRKHYGHWVKDEMVLYQQYLRLAAEHRIEFHKSYFSFLEGAGGQDVLTQGSPSFLSFFKEAGNATLDLPIPQREKDHPTESYWRGLERSVVRHHLAKQVYVYYSDEPNASDLVSMAGPLQEIHAWAPSIQILVTKHFQPSLKDLVQVWAVNLSQWGQPGFPSAKFYEERKRKIGQDFWLYTACDAHGCSESKDLNIPDLVMDREAAYVRAFPWAALRYGAGGILYYDTVAGYNGGPDSLEPWQDDFKFHGYGEGNLFYPCNLKLCGVREPLVFPSLRLKVLRDGLEDVEIIAAAMRVRPEVKDWVLQVMPQVNQFPKTIEPYEALKVKALEILKNVAKSSSD